MHQPLMWTSVAPNSNFFSCLFLYTITLLHVTGRKWKLEKHLNDCWICKKSQHCSIMIIIVVSWTSLIGRRTFSDNWLYLREKNIVALYSRSPIFSTLSPGGVEAWRQIYYNKKQKLCCLTEKLCDPVFTKWFSLDLLLVKAYVETPATTYN